MKKNNYIAPALRIVQLKVKHHLLEPSLAGTNMGNDLRDLNMGGPTSTADSRRRGYWDDDEYEY